MSEPKDPQMKVVDRRWWARGEAAAAEDKTEARKPTYIEEMEQRLASTTEQLQQVLTEHRRAQHEFDESRARMRREVAREVDRGRRAMLAELLDVLDNLDRALASAREGSGAAEQTMAFTSFARGVALVRDQFLSRLEQFGVTRIETLGQPFDAARHEAVSTVPVVDPEQDGRIVAVLKDGYASGDELLRPASVVVGSFSPNNAPHV
jgi:molecular chaperone GrpE